MSYISFCKFHGFLNDYIVLEKSNFPDTYDFQQLALTICDRHAGVGADGIAIIDQLDGERADFFCELINPDGSIAGFSGNGTRCAVAFMHYKGLWKDQKLRLETRSGVKNFTLIQEVSRGHYWFETEIGKPYFRSEQIPIDIAHPQQSVIDFPIDLADGVLLIAAVNVGNPVACIFVSEFDLDWRKYGRELETHPAFPQKANVVFVKTLDRENIEIRIWERGAGETSASGTCAAAAAVLSAFTGRSDRTVSVVTPGGTTEVHWRDDDQVLITGKADIVFCGEWKL